TNGMLALSAPPGGLPRIEGASRGPALRTLFRDARGTWWLGTNNGAWSLSNGAYRRVPITPPPATAVTAVTSAAGRGVWFGYNGWLYRWDGTAASPLQTAPSQHVEQITQAVADSTGRVWIAYGNGRIGVIDTTGTFRVADDREGLANATQP